MSVDDLPETWKSIKLGDVIDYGRTDKAEPSQIAPDSWVLELEDIEKDTSKLLQRITFSQRLSKSTKNRFKRGDVLYGKLRPYLNKVIIANEPGYCSTEIVPLKSPQCVDGRYLFYWLKHPQFLSYVDSVSHGINMPRLGTDAGKNAPFVLAPLNEQVRIANKLDVLLGRINVCRERLAQVPELLKRFRAAVVSEAIDGKLTKDWREGNNLTSIWQQCKLSEVCVSINDGDHQAPPRAEAGIPFITIAAINDGRLRINAATRYVPYEYFDALKPSRKAERGDVLYSVTGSISIPALVDTDDPFTFQRHIALLKPDPSVLLGPFLSIWLASEAVKSQALGVATGTAQLTIPIGGLRNFRIALPTLKEQTEIVRRVNALFAMADNLSSTLASARARIEMLIPAALAKAFTGELVQHDPNDEPAEVLLKRIRIERTDHKQKPRPRNTKTAEDSFIMVRKLIDVLAEADDWLPAQEVFRRCGIGDGSETEEVEALYAELRLLDKAGRLAVEPVTDNRGIKQHDRVKLLLR